MEMVVKLIILYIILVPSIFVFGKIFFMALKSEIEEKLTLISACKIILLIYGVLFIFSPLMFK